MSTASEIEPHPGQLHPPRQPARARPARVDAGHADRDEQRAGRRTPARPGSRVPLAGHRTIDRIGERDPGRLRRLAGQPTDATGSSRGPASRRCPARRPATAAPARRRHPGPDRSSASTMMPVVIITEAELARRADHPVGDVPVGLAGGDGEIAGQHGSGQGDHDMSPTAKLWAPQTMPRDELSPGRCAARRRPGTSGSSCRCSAAPRRSPSTLPITSGPVTSAPAVLDGLDLEPGPDQGLGQAATVKLIGQRGVLAQPAQRRPHRLSLHDRAHRASPTSERLKRTSPSIMSRMSSELLRNIRVRSTPIPKAKPE